MNVPLITGQKPALPSMEVLVGAANGHVVIERLLHNIDTTRIPLELDKAVGVMIGIGAAIDKLRPGALAGILRDWQRQLGDIQAVVEVGNGHIGR